MVSKPTLAVLSVPWMLVAQDGLRPVIGGPPFGAGIALGVEYRRSRLMGGPLDFSARGVGSVKKYELFETGFTLPRLAGSLLFAEVRARYRNYPEEDFWGIGSRSSRDRRTNFRLEDVEGTASFGVRPKRWLDLGVAAGFLAVNTGPGKDKDWPSIEQRFTAAEVPALDSQPHYLHNGAFLRVDYRDESADPRWGGLYEFRWTRFHDRDFGRFHFHRYQIDLRQYFPLFQERDTVAVRALTVLSSKSAGHQVPFFLQPTVGGGSDLRGYHQYRFRDENALVGNLEYRWRVREMLHAIGFADAGRVFSRPGQIGLSGLRGSAGAGGRLKLGQRIWFGIDLGWSPDGFRLWFRGAHTF